MSKHSFRFLKPHPGELDTLELRAWFKKGNQMNITVQVSETEVTLEIPDTVNPRELADLMGAVSFLGSMFDQAMDKLMARFIERFGKPDDGNMQK